MAFNRKELKVEPTTKKNQNPYSKDVIVDPMGQWKYPGEITKIPSNQITMEGVPYPVLGVDDLGNEQMMYPGMNYTFPGDNVTEYPQMDEAKYGGLKRRRSTSNPAVGVNDLMLRNPKYHTRKGAHFVPFKEEGGSTGGWLDKYQPGGDTSNWEQSSLDSLSLYNTYLKNLEFRKDLPKPTYREFNNEIKDIYIPEEDTDIYLERNKPFIQAIENDTIINNKKYLNNKFKTINIPETYDLNKKGIAPIGQLTYDGSRGVVFNDTDIIKQNWDIIENSKDNGGDFTGADGKKYKNQAFAGDISYLNVYQKPVGVQKKPVQATPYIDPNLNKPVKPTGPTKYQIVSGTGQKYYFVNNQPVDSVDKYNAAKAVEIDRKTGLPIGQQPVTKKQMGGWLDNYDKQ